VMIAHSWPVRKSLRACRNTELLLRISVPAGAKKRARISRSGLSVSVPRRKAERNQCPAGESGTQLDSRWLLRRAGVLHDFRPSLDAPLQRVQCFLRGREQNFAQLRHLTDIGFEGGSDEISLHLERLMDRLAAEESLRSRN